MARLQLPLSVASSNQQRRSVFAHFMVGNTFPYTVEDWSTDIELASTNDIDGFVLNVGKEDWQEERVSDCFEAMSRTKLPFKVFISFDMSSIPSQTKDDVQLLRRYLKAFALHPNMYRLNGKVVVSTFAGENSLFGFTSLEQAWSFVKKSLGEIAPIHFIPSFFIDPARYPKISSLDGAFNFNGGWPLQLNPTMRRDEIEFPTLDSDQDYIRNLVGRTFMTAVSPWFFTHYGPDTWNKNWIFRADDWLFVRRWEQLIANRARISIAQIISWNDYGESHYIGPIKGAQPNSQLWVDGFPHDAWLHLNRYFARAFKDGKYPIIEKDEIYMWARPHPKEAVAPERVPKPTNWELTDDIFWVVVFSPAPATVTLYTSRGDDEESVDVQAGVTKLSHALRMNRGMGARIERGGRLMAECNPDEFLFKEKPQVYNFNAFVAKSE